MKLLFRVVAYYGIRANIHTYMQKNISMNVPDYDIIYGLMNLKYYTKPSPSKPSTSPSQRGQRRGADIVNILRLIKRMSVSKYLDIGAGDGSVTAGVAAVLKLNRNNTHAVDQKLWIGKENKVQTYVDKRVTFSFISNNTIPYADGIFDLITIFQALHHFKNLNKMMSEVRRLCAPKGVVIIREHDAIDKYVKALVDLEHIMYGALSDGTPADEFISGYYGNYMPSGQWDKIFDKYGFDVVYTKKKKNPTRYYYAAYIKR